MKRVKLTNITEPVAGSSFIKDSFYYVNLGNGIKKSFKSKAKAVAFINEVSKYLTYKLHECNELYISLFTYYRRAWFYFDHNRVGQSHNLAGLYHKEREINHCLETIDKGFDILYKRSGYENGNYFVFSHFYNILKSCLIITELLFEVYETRSVASTLYEIEILKTKIQYCKKTIENYSIELENSFNEVEKVHLEIIKSA